MQTDIPIKVFTEASAIYLHASFSGCIQICFVIFVSLTSLQSYDTLVLVK